MPPFECLLLRSALRYQQKTGRAVKRPADALRALGITHILNACGDNKRKMTCPDDFRYLYLRGLADRRGCANQLARVGGWSDGVIRGR